MSINFRQFDKYNRIKINHVGNLFSSRNKEEALVIGFLDKINDKLLTFAPEYKLSTQLNNHYQELNELLAPVGGVHQASKLLLFFTIANMVDSENESEFTCEQTTSATGMSKQFSLSIAGELIGEIPATPIEQHIYARFENSLGSSINELMQFELSIKKALQLPIENVIREYHNTIDRFIYSTTAVNAYPYEIVRNYMPLKRNELDDLENQLNEYFENSLSLNEFIMLLDNERFEYGNCTTQTLFLAAKLHQCGYQISIHDIGIIGVPHTTLVVKAKEGVYLLDPWTGNDLYLGDNNNVLDVDFLSKECKLKIFHRLCPNAQINQLIQAFDLLSWNNQKFDVPDADAVSGVGIKAATGKEWHDKTD